MHAPDGEAIGCNPIEVGSTPTGVFEGTSFGVARPGLALRNSSRPLDGAPTPTVKRLPQAHHGLGHRAPKTAGNHRRRGRNCLQ